MKIGRIRNELYRGKDTKSYRDKLSKQNHDRKGVTEQASISVGHSLTVAVLLKDVEEI